MLKTTLLILAASVLSQSQAASEASTQKLHRIEATAQVSAEGVVTKLEWLHVEQVSPEIDRMLRKATADLAFVPATLNRKPVASEVPIDIIVASQPNDAGEMTLHFVAVEKAALFVDKMLPPSYPEQLIQAGVSGMLTVEVSIDSRGRVISGSERLADNTFKNIREKRLINAFYGATKRTIANAQFSRMEKVAGAKVSGKAFIPFVFCFDGCDALKAEAKKRESELALIPQDGVQLAQLR